MLVQGNFRADFYEIIKRDHVLIIANADVDALCSTIILTYLLKCDDVTYSITPVNSIKSLHKAIKEHSERKTIALINCIGSNSLLDLEISEGTKIFVLESRRPINLDNIFNPDPIRVLTNANEVNEWQVPRLDQIYNPEPSSDEDSEHSDENEHESLLGDNDSDNAGSDCGGKRRKRHEREDVASRIERKAIKRQRKIEWARNKQNLEWEYYMSSWYSTPSSVMLLELASDLGRINPEILWHAAVGLSSQFADNLISIEKYTEICIDLMGAFIRKYAPKPGASIDQERGKDQLRVSFDYELVIPVYSHWTLYDSMANDAFFICQSRLWTQKGEQNFRAILAKLGLTLDECKKQRFCSLSKERRKEVVEILMKYLDSGFSSFTSHLGYSINFNAIDFARALSVQLESGKFPNRRKPGTINQNDNNQGEPNQSVSCISSLCDEDPELCKRFTETELILRHYFKPGSRDIDRIQQSIEAYKEVLRMTNGLVCRSIQHSHVVSASRYFLITLNQHALIPYLSSSRHCLFLFSNTLLKVFASAKSSRKKKPLIVAIPLNDQKSMDQRAHQYHLITGVMPLSELVMDPQRKSVIGRAFQHVANESGIEFHSSIDFNVIIIRSEDRLKFFSSLEAKLDLV